MLLFGCQLIPMWFTVHVFGRGSRCVDHSVRKFKCDDHGMTLFLKKIIAFPNIKFYHL